MVHPTKSGFWWLSLDDGCEVTHSAELVRVVIHPDGGGLDIYWCDASGHVISLLASDQKIGLLTQSGNIALYFGTTRKIGDRRLTWLGEVKPPRTAPKQGEARTL